MIISASRRTDIPAFYSEWFSNRIKAGYLYVRNPFNVHKISFIEINPEVIDCIVFWTKNPEPMLNSLENYRNYNYYFQYTLNSYDNDMEINLTRKQKAIKIFQKLSDIIGPDKVLWRYDPIIISPRYDVSWHLKYFEIIAKKLSTYTRRCTISFLDLYKKTEGNLKGTQSRTPDIDEIYFLSEKIKNIAESYNISVRTCAEEIDLSHLGVNHGKCIDDELINEISRRKIIAKKDKNQRDVCKCVSSIDIGVYNTCLHNCLYCYATYNRNAARSNMKLHDPESPLLVGNVTSQDEIIKRDMGSFFSDENYLF